MAIRKQEFYEGAALYLLARRGGIRRIRYEPPFFRINETVHVMLKYSTRVRSPWGFTFSPEEQQGLVDRSQDGRLFVGLICGSDGVATVTFAGFETIAPTKASSVHVSCYRQHRGHFEVRGPAGVLPGKVAPSDWLRVLED